MSDINNEKWMPIVGYENEFMVSNYGRIRGLSRFVRTSIDGKGVRFIQSRVRKLQKHTAGYRVIFLKRGELYKFVHRIVAEAFLPNPNNKPFVNHKNGDKSDNRVENLEWVTRKENEIHAYSTGLKNSTGSSNSMAKLSEDAVRHIRRMYQDGVSKSQMAILYNVHVATVRRVLSGSMWKHVS